MRIGRWIKRGVLVLLGLIVVAIVAVVIIVHTSFGREIVRSQIESQLNGMFVGGGSVGKVDGSPFTKLVLTDVVINGPDGQPAISVKKLTIGLALTALVSKHVNLTSVNVDGLDVRLARNQDGSLQMENLLKPQPSSGWSVNIPDLQIHHGHVLYDTGTEWMNADAIELYGAMHMPYQGVLSANVVILGAWRERAAGLELATVLTLLGDKLTLPSLIARVGAVTVAATNVEVVTPPEGGAPILGGTLIVNAPAVGVRQLVPDLLLPGDIAFAATLSNSIPWTKISLRGHVGTTPVHAMLDADINLKSAKGVIASGDLDLTSLTHGKVQGAGGGVLMFEIRPGEAGKLPSARGVLAGWGQVEDFPSARIAVAFDTLGDQARTVVGVSSENLRAAVEGQVLRVGETLTLSHSTIVASSTDPSKASAGKAPLHGSVSIKLAAAGALLPRPDLAVTGRVDGKRLRFQDLSVSTLKLFVNAKHLPRRPAGKAELELTGIMRGTMKLGALKVTAANRKDGKIQVSARSKPMTDPWLVDVDALVTPPGNGPVTIVEIQRHKVRAGNGTEWTGTHGRVEIGERRIVVSELESESASGAFAISGELVRATGDITAKVEAHGLALANFDSAYRGVVDANIDVTRRRGKFAGSVDLKGTGIAVTSYPHVFDVEAHVEAAADKLVVDASASSTVFGSAAIVLDVDAPKDITNIQQWKHLHRQVIRTGKVSFKNIDLVQLAEAAGRPGALTSGKVDGELEFSAETTGGLVHIRDVMAPALRDVGVVNADLSLSPTNADELQATLTGTVATVGSFTAVARVGTPDHLFDPDAWVAQGPHALRGATLRVEEIEIDAAQLERLGITTELRGRISGVAEIGDAMESAQIAVDVKQLRGERIAKPVDAHFAVAIDGVGTTAVVLVRSGKITLLDIKGKVPLTMAQLRENPRAALSTPLQITATIPSAPAPALMAVFGRSEIIGGTLEGKVDITGTVGAPLATMKIVGTRLEMPPGPRNKPIKIIDTMTIDGTWDGTIAKIDVDAVEPGGSLKLVARVDPHNLKEGTVTIQAKAFDLVPLLAFMPGPAGGAAGRLDANLTLKGLDPAIARIGGELHLTGARVPVAPQIGTLQHANIDIVITEQGLKIDVVGKLGDGDVKLASMFQLEGAMPVSGDATVTLRKVSPIGSVEPVISADVTAHLTRKGDQWTADVGVRRGDIFVPDSSGEALDPVGAPPDMVFLSGKRVTNRAMKKEPPSHPSIIANVTLYSTNVTATELRAVIHGKLQVTADAEAVGVVGSIEADRADLDLFTRRYNVDKAAVYFDGSTDPLLDLRITHDFSDVTTITTVRGRVSKPELMMSSDPGQYSQGQLLGFLLGGEPGGDPNSGSARDQATSAGSSFVANKLGGYVKKALPIDIDVLRYEASSASRGSAVLVGKWITRSLFVAYRQHLESRLDENRSEGELEYWLTRRLSVDGTVGDRGYNGVDLLWRKRY